MEEQTALAVRDVDAVPAEAGEITSLVELAIREKMPVEVLERLVALQERVTDRNAELAMAEALAAFQAECPPIPRTKTAEVRKNGTFQYSYHFAPLDKIAEVIRPYLQKHGLAYTHDGRVTDGEVESTCTLTHVAGAKRTATFRGPIDTSGGKNPIQQVASARSYGRRYSLIDVLGLTTEDDDDGAATASGEPISDEQAATLKDLLQKSGKDVRKWLAWMGHETVDEIPASEYFRAVGSLNEAIRKREAREGGDA